MAKKSQINNAVSNSGEDNSDLGYLRRELARLRQENARLRARLDSSMPYSSTTTQVISCDTVSQQSIIEQVVAIIATRFINVSPDTLDNEIVNALGVIGNVTGVDRCCIVLLEDDEVTIKKRYEWHLDDCVSTDADSTYVSLAPFKWFLDKLSNFETLHIPQILELPSEADFEKMTWSQKGIISLVAIPLVLNNVLLGFFGVVSQYSERQWSSGEVKLLELLGSIFVNALVHRQSIEQLRASEAHNRALLAAIPDLVFVLTQEGVFLNCTQKEGLTLLLPPEQFIGRHMAEVLPPDVVQTAQENIDRALETGAVQCYEYELLLPGNVTPRIYEARLSLSSEGQVLVVSRDVTDYKDAVAALQWRNHELSFLNRVVLIGASSTDVIEVLQVLCDELAFTFELPQVGAAFVDIETGTFEIVAEYQIPSRLPIIGNREQAQDVGEFMRLFDTQQPLRITGQALDKLGELGRAVHQQGTESVLFVPLVVRNKVISVLGMDITPLQTLDDPADLMLIQSAAMTAAQALEAAELNQTLQRRAKNLESLVEQRTEELQVALAQAKAADLAKTRFLRSVSHELRTPLTDMKLYLDLLERGRGDRRQSYFEALRHITDDFQALIEELLEISRFDLGNVQIHLWPTDINQLVKLVVDAYQKQFVEHNLCLEVLPAQRLPLMSVDTKLMQRAINNLLKNALIYTPSGGDISVYTDIGTRDEQEWVIISIKDTGVGISEEDYPLLFTPFFRGKAYENHNVPGAGLGLPITKQILELHDGNITVESELGKGSVFTIWLPMTLSVGDP